MRCEEARGALPAYAHDELADRAHVEVHLASCEGCARELDRYRELAAALRVLRDDVREADPALKSRVLATVPRPGFRDDIRRLADEHPGARVAAVSLGGAALGAAAISLLWWRAARRKYARTPGAAPAPID